MSRKEFVDHYDVLGPKDEGFTFPLPTQVEGLNARGKEFTEETILSYISHQGSSFYLKNPVNIGCRLRLVIDLPEKLAEDRNLKLVIKGKVALVETINDHNTGQKVTIRFDSKYIIKPES